MSEKRTKHRISGEKQKKLRVAAYCRVSTLMDAQDTALRFIIRCGTAGSVRRGKLETAAGIRRLRKRNCCAEYPMRSAGNGRERKNLARSDFCGKCRPFILKMERRAFKSGRSACLRKCISGETEPPAADFLSKYSKGEMESAAFFVISAGET